MTPTISKVLTMTGSTVSSSHVEESQVAEAEVELRLEEFLMKHHGRIDLNPLPSMSLNDPLNWPTWKKNLWLFQVAFHAMFALFSSAVLIPAYIIFVEEYDITLTQASYLTSVQIICSGVAPLIWSPLSSRYGRRPIFLISTLASCVCNIGGAQSTTYAAQVTTRILLSIFVCPPLAIGSPIVTETFFAHERAAKMGIWTLMVTLSTSLGPFLFGFLIQRQPTQWIFWTLAIINLCQFLAYFFTNLESRYCHPENGSSSFQNEKPQKVLSVQRIDPNPIVLSDFIQPVRAARYPSIIIPSVAYAIVFGYAAVCITVEMPQVMGEKFHLDAQGVGLQFLAIIIGGILGQQVSGRLSDWFVRYMNRSRHTANDSESAGVDNGNAVVRTQTIGGHTNIDPTPRLYLAYVGTLLSCVGLILWGVESQIAEPGNWTVNPLIGAAIAAFGNQMVTTTLITFAVDCHRSLSAEIGVLVNLIRQVWGFIGPFYFPSMFEHLGFGGSGGLLGGIVAIVAGGAILGLHLWEHKKFKNKGILSR